MGEGDGSIDSADFAGDPSDRNAAFEKRKRERAADRSASGDGNVYLGQLNHGQPTLRYPGPISAPQPSTPRSPRA